MDDRSWSFTVILYLQDANHRAKKKTMCHNVSGLDWTIHGSFLWTLSQTFRSSFLMLTWYWLQLFQLWDGAGSSPLMSCLFMSLICLPANVGYILQLLPVYQFPQETQVIWTSATLFDRTQENGSHRYKTNPRPRTYLLKAMMLEVTSAWYSFHRHGHWWSFIAVHDHSILGACKSWSEERDACWSCCCTWLIDW